MTTSGDYNRNLLVLLSAMNQQVQPVDVGLGYVNCGARDLSPVRRSASEKRTQITA